MTRLPGLDLLRALAIALVLLFHARIMRIGASLDLLSQFGWMGVDLFFVLSGYLIGTQWLRRRDAPGALGDFYRRRVRRIVPAFLLVFAVYEAFPAWREAPHLMPWWQYVTFTENLFITFDVPRAFTHVWSLCVEEHFYVVFPLASLLVLRRAPRWGGPLLISLVLGGLGLRAWLWFTRVVTAPEPFVAYYEQLYYPTWCRLDGLLAGIGAAALQVFRPRHFEVLARRQGPLLAGAALCLGVSAWLFRDDATAAAAIIGFPLIALGMGCLVVAATQWRFRVPGAAGLAAIAYSLYLSHKLCFAAVRDHLQPGPDLTWWLSMGLALLVGAALYRFVERPFLRLRPTQG